MRTVLLCWWIVFLRVSCSICVCCILILLMKTVHVHCSIIRYSIPHCTHTHTHAHAHASVRVEILSWFCFHVANNSKFYCQMTVITEVNLSVISSWEVCVFWSIFWHWLPAKSYLVWVLLILSGCRLSSSQICDMHIQLDCDFMVSHTHCVCESRFVEGMFVCLC